MAARGAIWAMLRAAVLILVLAAGLIYWQGKNANVGNLSDLRGWLNRLPRPSAAATKAPPRGDRVNPGQVTKDSRVICFNAKCRRDHPE